MSISSAKALAVYSPLPDYPREARSRRITGSGVCVVSVDPGTGNVTEASMAQSTGDQTLDKATVSAFRRWVFKPGKVSTVRIPVDFTLTGATY
jgi:TonB family protein